MSGGHCLTPRYLNDQIERSRRNLGLAFIDVYYLHNPEQQLDVLSRSKFLSVIGAAFSTLEQQVERGIIGCYGCSTWNGFRVPPEARNHLSLEELVNVAREVGGENHHFKIIQLPINLAMTEAVRVPTQCVGTDRVSLLEAAHRVDMGVVGSATLMQSQLTRSLPDQLRSAFPGFNSDARRAIAFAQSLPVTAALVGMKSVAHPRTEPGARSAQLEICNPEIGRDIIVWLNRKCGFPRTIGQEVAFATRGRVRRCTDFLIS